MEYDTLPLTAELTSELKMWAKRRLAQRTEDRQYVFVCLSTVAVNEQYFGQPFAKRSHVTARWCKKVEVTPFGWHAIRHLTASTLYRRGYSLSHIQAVLRHKSATTTARYLRTLGIDEVRACWTKASSGNAKSFGLAKRKRHQDAIPDTVLRPDLTSGVQTGWVAP